MHHNHVGLLYPDVQLRLEVQWRLQREEDEQLLRQISSGLASMDNITAVSRNAARTGGSRMGLNENEQVTVEQLLTGMAVSSGNDASTAMAEYVGGSVPAFINMMNAKARTLGMRDSCFVNPHGLPAKGQYTTARQSRLRGVSREDSRCPAKGKFCL